MLLARVAAALLLCSLLTACRASPVPSGPRAERARATSPAELLPDDLDFVVRIDVARIRQNPALAGVVRDLAKTKQSELLSSIHAALGEASAVWAGTRWMSDGFHGDGVVALEGPPGSDSADMARPTMQAPLRRIATPAPDIEAFERPANRGEAALEIVMGGHGVVLATAAEADAVLRVLRSGPDEGRLEPPARGLVSFAGRLRGGAPFGVASTGIMRGLGDGLVGYAGSLEEAESSTAPDAGAATTAIEVEATLVYASAAEAASAGKHAKQAIERLGLAGGVLERLANSVKLNETGASVNVRATLPFAWLAELH